jgi:hypothetical protein
LTTNRSSKSTSTNRENQAAPKGTYQVFHSRKLLLHGTTRHAPGPKTGDHALRHQYKMLASTMQFPNNNPVAPTTRAHPLRPHGRRGIRTRFRPCAGQPKQRPQGRHAHVRGIPVSCCLRTQQCAKDPNGTADRTFPTPPKRGVLGTGRDEPSGPRFVDIPPMSARRTTQGSAAGNTEHPRGNRCGLPCLVLVAP